jgi:hypothetical protein
MLDVSMCKDMQQGVGSSCSVLGGTDNPDFCKEGGNMCKITVSAMQPCGDDARCNDPTKGKKPCCASMAAYQKATLIGICSGVNAKLIDEAVCCPRLRCCTGGLSGGSYNYQRVPRPVVPVCRSAPADRAKSLCLPPTCSCADGFDDPCKQGHGRVLRF